MSKKNDIALRKQESQSLLAKNPRIIEGAECLSNDGRLFRIRKIKTDNEGDTQIETEYEGNDSQWHQYGTYSIKEFLEEYIFLDKPLEVMEREAADSLFKSEPESEQDADDTMSSEMSLMGRGSKEALVKMQDEFESKRQVMEARQIVLRRVLERKMNELNAIARRFADQLKKIGDVLYTIELYLGIREKVILLADGPRAPQEDAICFRQELLFMDEEMGDPDDGGLDFRNIEDFDHWLIRNSNFKKLIPESRGVISMRVRRSMKEYHPNPYVNCSMQAEDKKTYILIRNGERVCRIWGDITTNSRLFPRKNEFADLMDIIEKRKTHDEHGSYIFPSDIERAESKVLHYKRQMIMLQGLIDRTELFHPLPAAEIKLNDPSAHEKGYVRYIYDDEIRLPDSRLPFADWKEKINSKITEGSRVILSGRYYERRKDYIERFPMKWKAQESGRDYVHIPQLPDAGIYTVIEIEVPPLYARYEKGEDKVPKKALAIRYNPGDEVGEGWGSWDTHTRKNKISFIIYPDDDFVLNFDEADKEDVSFYLESRINRREYLSMMPVLFTIKQAREREEASEADFITMTVSETARRLDCKTAADIESIAEAVRANVSWWKLKNKWKRAIEKDDAKALRMIVGKTIRDLK